MACVVVRQGSVMGCWFAMRRVGAYGWWRVPDVVVRY